MKSRMIVLCVLLVSATALVASDYYKLEQVKRLDQDLYSARSGSTKILIQTRNCYHYTYGSEAVLKYERYSYDNKIIFDDETNCAVVKVISQ